MSVTKIATVTVGSGGQAAIEFLSIAGTFTDLMIQVSLRTNSGSADDFFKVKFNTSSSNFTSRILYGSGSSAASFSDTTGYAGAINGNGATASTFSNSQIYIPNYASATNKSWSVDSVGETNATAIYSGIVAGLWSQTAAITSVSLVPGSGSSFNQYSTATLYGITKGSLAGVTVS